MSPEMVNPPPLRPPCLVAEDPGTGEIPADLVAILAAHYRTVREDGTARIPEERSGRVIHSFLAQLVSGVNLFPGLERVTMVGIEPDRRVLLLKSLFSVQVNVYLTKRRLFAYLGELPAEPPTPGGGDP